MGLFFYLIGQVTRHAHERLINENKGHLIFAPHFHLSEGGNVTVSEWTAICFIKQMKLGRSSEEL